MVAKKNHLDYSSVPTTAELENNSNQKKYTVNRTSKGDLVISKIVCGLLVLLAMILIALAALLTYFLLPYCPNEATPEALRKAVVKDGPARLPRSIQPLHYRLQIIPFLEEGNFTTNGAVQINVNVTESTNKIELNINDIEINQHSVAVKRVSDDKSVKVSDQKYDNESQKYIISLAESLKEGDQYQIAITYNGKLNDYMQGFYRSSYIDSNTKDVRWIASTQFSPTDARRAFPCFDEPSFKAKYTVSIARPSNMTSLSNMPKRESVVVVDRKDWIWDHFKETPQMSSYLVAFVVSDLQPFRFNSSEKLFTIWSRRDALEQTRLAMDIGPRILSYFERYFGIDYPLPKIDMVAVPDFGFNAMENWGLITFREAVLLFDEKISTVEDKRAVATVLAHELAHQWFGNLVTPKWWDDLWLKEGFASYLLYYGVNFVFPDWNILTEFIMTEVHKAFAIDSLKSTHPLTFTVHSTDEIRQMFDPISYSKGASIIRMINNFLGERTFKAGLIKYLHTFTYSNARRDDLWDVLTQQAHEDGNLHDDLSIKEIMDSWTVQSGFPVVTAVRNGKRVDVSQKRFTFDKSFAEDTLWWVPLSYTTDLRTNFDDTSPKQWLKKETGKNFEIEANRWWLVNPHQTGISHSSFFMTSSLWIASLL
ncbi:puromycin-sensitive aminopeptidase-like protein isoform X1 [Agrilus planipennis]|uniref:Puromycin-sensitive aminopeptidase-like protein isoform X1 n=2 Tax=Agrilus planipennis TaxID=224129 RepID=A0A7F5QZE7_AGRPL|nr:puromycin-sensitive aminopeptidase-like protein isoform X1 [Agrilus planipennis]